MYNNVRLKELMFEDYPKVYIQKKKLYVTTIKEVRALHRLINREVFRNQLPVPIFVLKNRTREMWGACQGFHHNLGKRKSRCKIELATRWYCRQWLIMILAHEMVHQYQWDIMGKIRIRNGMDPLISHGPSFFIFRNKLKKFGIPLREFTDIDKWFEKQDLFSC